MICFAKDVLSVTGNRTLVSRVTGGDTSHYTMTEFVNPSICIKYHNLLSHDVFNRHYLICCVGIKLQPNWHGVVTKRRVAVKKVFLDCLSSFFCLHIHEYCNNFLVYELRVHYRYYLIFIHECQFPRWKLQNTILHVPIDYCKEYSYINIMYTTHSCWNYFSHHHCSIKSKKKYWDGDI